MLSAEFVKLVVLTAKRQAEFINSLRKGGIIWYVQIFVGFKSRFWHVAPCGTTLVTSQPSNHSKEMDAIAEMQEHAWEKGKAENSLWREIL